MKKIHVGKHEKSYSKKSKKKGKFPVRAHDRHIESSHECIYTNIEEKRISDKNCQKRIVMQKCAEAIMYHTPTLREIMLSYKIASNVCSIWNNFSTISQREDKVNVAVDVAKAGLSMYQVKMMYDLIDNNKVSEKLDAKKILGNVFLDLTKEEISLVFSSI